MGFTETVFVPFIFAVNLLAGLSKDRKYILSVLLIFNFIFYAWWEPAFLLLLVAITTMDFHWARFIDRQNSVTKRKMALATSLTVNLVVLGYYKYADFFLEVIFSTLRLTSDFKIHQNPGSIVIPLGISFYTFESISYLTDVYRGTMHAEKSLRNYLFFISSFPHLVAGPLVRAKDFIGQLNSDFHHKSSFSGMSLVVYGFCKKVFLADIIAEVIVNPIYTNPSTYSSSAVWAAIFGYSFQIFFDFSAYSDIAIGLGMLLGLQFPKNFDNPYLAQNPSDFWRRWHISLSQWFRDYLYLPLGGSKEGPLLTLRNALIVMFLCGLWHGASVNFVIWGCLQGLLLIVYNSLNKKFKIRSSPFFSIPLMFFIVSLTWVFFREHDFGGTMQIFSTAFAFGGGGKSLSVGIVYVLLAGFLFNFIIEPKKDLLFTYLNKMNACLWALSVVFLSSLFVLTRLMGLTKQSFIYFQF